MDKGLIIGAEIMMSYLKGCGFIAQDIDSKNMAENAIGTYNEALQGSL